MNHREGYVHCGRLWVVHGTFPPSRVLDQLNLAPCRWTICHKYTRCGVVAADLSWAAVVIQNSFRASGRGYAMTYGQV